ncbi:hypothetical protein ACFW2V_13735 [Streptomyces sp. NPDC058947]|uniref:hypothetical protein n=1 Tax=Streptomyces sp. NPDC058947 TaxID=3346675 RepID=UPI0036AEAAA4
MKEHRLPEWVQEVLGGLTVERKLPKWPTLQVVGQDVGPDLGREICLRTASLSSLYPLGVNDWSRSVSSVLGVSVDDEGFPFHEDLRRVEEDLDTLDLTYLGNDRVSATRSSLLSGWCDWDGTIGTMGSHLGDKWPTLEKLNQELKLIARTWPQLKMTVQLSSYKTPDRFDELHPFLTWFVEGGKVFLRSQPGARLLPVRMPEIDPWNPPAEADQLVDIETLRRAINEAKEKNG